eukprot:CAMPEP_0196591384 /NCGR_PEP_ID=MMETSP1081-20130531/69416_1 /TAXON_ID=36882 /ORGANISM="Pyramimonas amylifera, Strain CCMP720" /LENGTH=93 /DNA_ID=CAMNT_0041914729 /DNA_START=1081 /DNA_END=1359 /DNA_ORIENTATION=-
MRVGGGGGGDGVAGGEGEGCRASKDCRKQQLLQGKENRDSAQPTPKWKSKEYALDYEEEEVCCPTCLEEYTEDNPQILTDCAHHFHLGCIYEW